MPKLQLGGVGSEQGMAAGTLCHPGSAGCVPAPLSLGCGAVRGSPGTAVFASLCRQTDTGSRLPELCGLRSQCRGSTAHCQPGLLPPFSLSFG